ncbi:hypothetical protein BJ944DRAFT_155602 [Cunninghamella echinulata]|nr:hypothetical protein BJ944DRAFT_155602 [Cunninghamella echinulata]
MIENTSNIQPKDYTPTPPPFSPVKLKDDQHYNDIIDDDDDTYNNSNRSSSSEHGYQDLRKEIEEDKKLYQAPSEDDDDEFDWNDDPDKPTTLNRKITKRERIQKAMQRPCCWSYLSSFMKRLIIGLIGSLIFVAIALLVYYYLPTPTEEEQNDPRFANIRSNVQLWMYWAAFMWHIGWITSMILEAIPSIVSLWVKIFVGRRSEKVKSRLEYYMSMKPYIIILFLGAWNWGSWAFLLDVLYSSVKKQGYSAIVSKIFALIFSCTCFLFVQKLIIQLIATRFHRSAYSERIEENKYSLKVLDSLSKSEGKKSRPDSSNNNLRQRVKSNESQESSNSALENSSYASGYNGQMKTKPNYQRNQSSDKLNNFQKKMQSYILTDNPQKLVRMQTRKTDINSDNHAKKVAKKLFYALAYPHGAFSTNPNFTFDQQQNKQEAKMLERHHFRPYFKTEEETQRAYELFDKDGNGDISRREFRDTVIGIYRERKSLAQCIRDTSQALGKIDIIIFLIFLLINIFICISTIFGVNLYQALIPLGTFIMGLSFMFSETVKVAFQSIMFLFVTHPYDAGDYCIIDSQTLLVHNMGITGTVFIRADGQKIYAPTSVLMTKLITNVRRSPSMGESITLNVDFRTSTDLIFTLRDRLAAWVNDQPREYASGFDVRLQDIMDMNKLVLTIWLPHKTNWQDIGKRLQRRNRFMFYLKDTLHELRIRYELPAQRFTSEKEFEEDLNLTATTPQSFGGIAHHARMYRNQSTSNAVDGS